MLTFDEYQWQTIKDSNLQILRYSNGIIKIRATGGRSVIEIQNMGHELGIRATTGIFAILGSINIVPDI